MSTDIKTIVEWIGKYTRQLVNAKYTKPSTGIPKTDLASTVQTSLGKADTALQQNDISGKAEKVNGRFINHIEIQDTSLDRNGGLTNSVWGSAFSVSDKNGNWFAGMKTENHSWNDSNYFSMTLYKENDSASLGLILKSNGEKYAEAPTPSANATGDEIATASWVNTKLSKFGGGGGHKIVKSIPSVETAEDSVVYFVEDEESTSAGNPIALVVTDLENRVGVLETEADYVISSGHSSDNTQWYRKWKSGWLEQGGKQTITNTEITINFIKPYTSIPHILTEVDDISVATNFGEGVSVGIVSLTNFKAHAYHSSALNTNNNCVWYAYGQGGED